VHLLRQRRLALLFAGAALNEIGSWASIIAFWGYAAYRFHSGPVQIALVSLMWSAPNALFSLVSGWPVDRFGPKKIMVAADVLGAVTALGMVWATSYGMLVALVLASGTVGAFGRPAANSLPPRIVDDADLLAANSLLSLTTQLALVIGPLIASVAIAVWSIRAAFVVDAVTFLIGIATTLPLPLRPVAAPSEHGPGPGDLLAGVRLSYRLPLVRKTMLLGLAVFCSWGASMVMEPLYVRDVLHRSSATFGLLQTIFGIGLICMTALMPRLGDRVVSIRAQAFAVLASAATVPLYLASGNLTVAAVGIFLWGMVTALFLPPFYTLLQRATPADSHGRVMAVSGTVNGLAGLAMTPLAGLAVGAFGVRACALVLAAGLAMAGAAGWWSAQDPVEEVARNESRAAASTG
jgi:MFS family permease